MIIVIQGICRVDEVEKVLIIILQRHSHSIMFSMENGRSLFFGHRGLSEATKITGIVEIFGIDFISI
jgi:hypothetical protein